MNLDDVEDLNLRVAREEQAAAAAKCEKSREAHLGLAQQYRQKLKQLDAVRTAVRLSAG